MNADALVLSASRRQLLRGFRAVQYTPQQLDGLLSDFLQMGMEPFCLGYVDAIVAADAGASVVLVLQLLNRYANYT